MESVPIEISPEGRRHLGQVTFDPQKIDAFIGNDVDAVGGFREGLIESGAVSGFQMQEHGLDMLAGTEPIDAKVGAGAVELPILEVPNLYGIGQSAAGLDRKIRKYRVFGKTIGNAERFFFRPYPPFEQFLFIGCAPVRGRWKTTVFFSDSIFGFGSVSRHALSKARLHDAITPKITLSG